MPPGAGYRGGTCIRATTTCPRTISILERRQECGALELRGIRVANGACFRELARHPWRCALADYKLGLAVGGDDQLPSFGQSVHQPGIVIKLTNAHGFHAVRQYCLTDWISSAELSRGQVFTRAIISSMTAFFRTIQFMSSLRLSLRSNPHLSGHKQHSIHCLGESLSENTPEFCVNRCGRSSCGNTLTLNTCRIILKLGSSFNSFLTMATRTYPQTAIHSCVLTALSDVPKNALMRRFCLIHLKNNSICQRPL